ncbi:MAG: alpha/beta hydrolase [Pseudomonadota bacterium]|nr:alpha/beta hydrolase [Pseudomonadota bacterium]
MTQFIVQGYPAYAYTGGKPHEPRAPAIVFIHGAAFDHSVWQWQSRYFAHHGHAVLAVDLPGHGRSPGPSRNSIVAAADWIAALIEAAGLERAAVIGHSMGSLVALETAIRHPGRVSKLALVGAAAPMPVGEAFTAAARDDSPAALDMEATWGHARSVLLAQSAVPGMSLHGASRALNARAHAGVLHNDLEACHAWQPPMDAIRALKVPTLVVAGRRDQMTAMKAGKALAAEIPGAKLVMLDAGHSMMSEAPRELLHELKNFLR